MRFDRTKPHGTINPPCLFPGYDRPAVYDQDGHLFDAHGVHLVKGQPAEQSSRPVQEIVTAEDAANRTYTPLELLAAVEEIPWALFQREAKRILGPACPAGKTPIVEALKKAISGYEAKETRRAKAGAKSKAPDLGEGEAAAPAPPPAPAAKGAVDLAAWARGNKQYPFGEVRKEIRRRFNQQVSGQNEAWDAVLLCVKEKLLTMAEARTDIVPVDGVVPDAG
jgi:hypothetical protein